MYTLFMVTLVIGFPCIILGIYGSWVERKIDKKYKALAEPKRHEPKHMDKAA